MDGSGRFMVRVGSKRGPKFPLASEPLREYIREYYDFLASDEEDAQLFGETASKQYTPTQRYAKVEFQIFGILVCEMIRMPEGGFCIFNIKLPFVSDRPDMDEYVDDTSAAPSDEVYIDEDM